MLGTHATSFFTNRSLCPANALGSIGKRKPSSHLLVLEKLLKLWKSPIQLTWTLVLVWNRNFQFFNEEVIKVTRGPFNISRPVRITSGNAFCCPIKTNNFSKSDKNKIMMELSDNVTYMKLVHELKAQFPNMPDELVHQSIKKVRLNQFSLK